MKKLLAVLLAGCLLFALLPAADSPAAGMKAVLRKARRRSPRMGRAFFLIKYAYMTTSVPKDVDLVTEKINGIPGRQNQREF